MSDPTPDPSPAPPPDVDPDAQPAGFGTFSGVFRPVFLTILGAMLYLREGWLVGNGGLVGALLVMVLAASITGLTARSLASIASNVRVRPGGAFAIVAQAMGLEAGGAIGVPLYIAQAASSAMYIYAFAEAWAYLFPTHPPGVVAMIAFAGVALLAWRSAGLAFRAQAWMLGVVGLALASAVGGLFVAPTVHAPVIVGRFADASPLTAFAIFFPAFTGIMVGAGMSGSLADPRRAIPRGTLGAWGITTGLYVGFAFWYALIAPQDELIANKTAMIDHALVPQLVLLGLLSSTLMAALSSLVAAPRLLAAMPPHDVVPAARWLSEKTPEGEPRHAVLATTAFAAVGLAAGSLDAIAPIITSFFIMTYLAINAIVYVEQVLGMISFRPAYRVPAWSPLLGAGLCLFGLSVASPFGGVLELLLVVGIYAALARRKLDTPWETVRSGIAVTLASWAARRVAHVERSERAWKPDMLVPVATLGQLEDLRALCEPLARRNGSLRWAALGPRDEVPERLEQVVTDEVARGLHTTWTRLRTDQYMAGVGLALDALRGALFPPNLVVVDERRVSDDELAQYLAHCRRLAVGLAVWQPHPAEPPLGERAAINVWVSDRSPEWKLELHVANLDLPVLVGFLLSQQWQARLRLVTAVRDPDTAEAARAFLASVVDQARLPDGTEVYVGVGPFHDELAACPRADLHVFGMPPTLEKERLQAVQARSGASCLWLLDSGRESALA